MSQLIMWFYQPVLQLKKIILISNSYFLRTVDGFIFISTCEKGKKQQTNNPQIFLTGKNAHCYQLRTITVIIAISLEARTNPSLKQDTRVLPRKSRKSKLTLSCQQKNCLFLHSSYFPYTPGAVSQTKSPKLYVIVQGTLAKQITL